MSVIGEKIEILLTRRCNLQCRYCAIRNNNYPNELTIDEWKRAFKILHELDEGVILILFGGEPLMLGKGLVELVKFNEKHDIPYAIISNSVNYEKYRDDLVKAGLRNWSTSLDPLACDHSTSIRKNKGLEALRWFRDHGNVKDLVTCSTIHRRNIEKTPNFVEFMTEEGIWTVTTPIQAGHDKSYEYSAQEEVIKDLLFRENDLPTIKHIGKILAKMARSGKYKMHNIPEYYDEIWNHYLISRDWHCSMKANVTVDADGRLRVCVDQRGKETNKLTVFDLADEEKRKKYFELAKLESKNCQGCVWDPAWQCEWFMKHDPERGIKWFRH